MLTVGVVKQCDKANCRIIPERKQCGRIDHKIIDCWESEESKSKRPSWWKNKEYGNTMVDEGHESLFCTLDLEQ
jgi:hypothetical protein